MSRAKHSRNSITSRIEIEFAHHGGRDDGQLPVPYRDFRAYGRDQAHARGTPTPKESAP